MRVRVFLVLSTDYLNQYLTLIWLCRYITDQLQKRLVIFLSFHGLYE
jgi:hypothetical protein